MPEAVVHLRAGQESHNVRAIAQYGGEHGKLVFRPAKIDEYGAVVPAAASDDDAAEHWEHF